MSNISTDGKPDLGKPQFSSHSYMEPVIVLAIMGTSLYMNRRKNYNIWGRRQAKAQSFEIENQSQDSLLAGVDGNHEGGSSVQGLSRSGKKRKCCGTVVETPNSSRFANHPHSRILQKFPFLVEMFYWILNYAAYSLTKGTAALLYGRQGNAVTQLAQDHGISILNIEHDSIFSFFFALKEADVQDFFLTKHLSTMTFLNRIYSLVHIPGTVAFLSWYYFVAPNHDTFAVARRTMTLGNFAAFFIFCFYPCMPPRLLPEEYGFKDTVRQEHAESVWVGDGKNVNQLAAMPSLHFTYAFVIGCTFFYHSGFLQSLRGKRPQGRSFLGMVLFLLLAIFYPILVLTVIVATANHYYLDAVVATFTVTAAFLCNRVWLVLLPAEDWLLWVLRLEKPVPTTGDLRGGKPEERTAKERSSLEQYGPV